MSQTALLAGPRTSRGAVPRGTAWLAAVLLAAAWLGPLPELAARSFAAHMTLHMTVVAVVAPLVAAGLAGGRFDLVRAAPVLMAAIPASLVELAVVWLWHAPALHGAARTSTAVFALEQASFLVAGVWFWMAVLGGDPDQQRARRGAGVIALLLTFAHMTLLGALLSLTPRPLYHHADHSDIGGAAIDRTGVPPADAGRADRARHAATPHATTSLTDQQLGGSIMLVVGSIAYIGGGIWLARLALRDPGPRGDRQ